MDNTNNINNIEQQDQVFITEIREHRLLDLFTRWAKFNGVDYTLASGWTHNPKIIEGDFRHWMNSIRYDEAIRGSQMVPPMPKLRPFNEQLHSKDAMYKFEETRRNTGMEQLKGRLKFDGSNDAAIEELGKFVKALTGNTDKLVMAAFHNYIWQIKRNLFGRTVEYPVMPVLYSKQQGVGKSINAKRISLMVSSPKGKESGVLADWASIVTKSDVADHRSIPMYGSNYVILCDEFELKPEQYSTLKTIITEPYISYRMMHTNNTHKTRKISAFIGTANLPLSSIIFDESGTRRFFQVNVRTFGVDGNLAELTAAQQRELEQVDYELIYRGVDESLDYAQTWHAQYHDEMASRVEDTRTKGDYELFMDEMGIRPARAGEKGFRIPKPELLKSFLEWSQDPYNTSKRWTKRDCTRKFEAEGMEIVTINGVQHYKIEYTDQAAALRNMAYDSVILTNGKPQANELI